MRSISPILTTLLTTSAMTTVAASVCAQEQTIELDPIVVTAAGVGIDLLKAPASVSVISGEDLQERSMTDLSQALSGVPGVTTAGGSADAENILIRGLPAEYTLVLVDGKRLNSRPSRTNGSGGVDQFYTPPTAAIERVEIVRGPMSSLYGSDAMGGVINIITKPVSDNWTGSITVEARVPENGDDSGESQQSLYLSGPVAGKRLGLQIWSRRLDRSASTRMENGVFVGASARDLTDLTGRLTWTPETGQELYLEAGRARMERTAVDLGRTSETLFEDSRYTLAAGYNGQWRRWDIQAVLSTENAARHTSTSRTGRMPEIHTQVLDLKSSSTLGSEGDHSVTIGTQVIHTNLKDQNLGLGSTEHRLFTNTQWAIFAEDVWSVSNRFDLTMGGRYTHDERFGSKVTPRIYATYELANSFYLVGGVSTGYRTPEVRESSSDYYSCTSGGCSRGVAPGNPNLLPEESTSYELDCAMRAPLVN